VLLTATTEPAVIELVPWWNSPHQAVVEAGLSTYSPTGT
jgi:hypothetical protein